MIRGVVLNPILNGVLRKYLMDPAKLGFAGLSLFPVFATALKSAQYYVFNKDVMLNVPTDIRRAPGANYKRTTTSLSDDLFNTISYGIEATVPDEVRAMYASSFDADRTGIERNAFVILLNQELRINAKATDTSKIAHSSPGTKWDQNGSKPRADVIAAKAAINTNSAGWEPNVMVISRETRDVLLEHSDVKENVKYTQGGNITDAQLAAYFGFDKLVVAGAFQNGAADGQAATASRIWGDTVTLAYVDPRASSDFEAPTFGRSFRWTGVGTMESYREQPIKSDVHQADDYVDEKLTGAELGYLLTDVLS